ncbi:Alpha-galactosidase, NEW3 domain [Syntrophomonas zehnderi OL-4]|uniref:Alpha-galactosidase, NEW3 domain n=1 Tax=Syntrophomonas zehnderi OL-4 TaxID=690567 RepID=A0A0E4GBV4_9FIRM|nr:NEW3 domain-containing protein [Syntrophomonas zehnderi]CFX83944.1 Alpha-galactosidase, NEW3 domain [Syntrophomonas zehnderi OL-4]
MKYSLLNLFLAFCLLINSVICLPAVAQDETDLQLQKGEPHIIIANNRWIPEFKAGSDATLNIPIDNTGTAPAYNVNVSLPVSEPDKFPFKTEKMTLNHYSTSIWPGSSVASFNLKIPPNVKPGTYPINVNVSYTTPSGGGGQVSGIIYTKITNSYRQPILQCTGVKFTGEKLPAGKTTIINLQMQNDGDLALQQIELRLGGFSANGISLDKWPETQNIRKMAAGETRLIAYKILVDQEVKTGTYTLDLTMKYQDEYNQEYTRDSKVYIPVAGKDNQDDLTPRIILENYDYGAATVAPGMTFPLNLVFVNTSETTAVRNIKISFNSDGQIFSPVGNSNSLYIPNMPAQGRIQKTLKFKPKAGAESQTYNINADIDYQDSKGTKLTEKEIISIPVSQEVRFVLSAVEVPPEAVLDSPQSISVSYHNSGKAMVRNLNLRVEGDFEIKDGLQYLGNLESGKNDYCDVTIIPHKTGKLTGKVFIDYEDDNGSQYQQTRDFSLQVVKAPEPIEPDSQTPADAPKQTWKKWLVIGGAFILLSITAAIIYRKRRHALEELEFEDE